MDRRCIYVRIPRPLLERGTSMYLSARLRPLKHVLFGRQARLVGNRSFRSLGLESMKLEHGLLVQSMLVRHRQSGTEFAALGRQHYNRHLVRVQLYLYACPLMSRR